MIAKRRGSAWKLTKSRSRRLGIHRVSGLFHTYSPPWGRDGHTSGDARCGS
nr:MAG TPA: hypothetical protein [Caudoviricetes sp.]